MSSRSILNIKINYTRFLLAQLHMDSLTTKHTPAAVRQALEILPQEVDAAYDKAMERIDGQPKDDKNWHIEFCPG